MRFIVVFVRLSGLPHYEDISDSSSRRKPGSTLILPLLTKTQTTAEWMASFAVERRFRLAPG
ncbi:hypothetical protein [Pseudoxanthomonas yeongjuensis]|uniref:hypothetical protein n=1 Tax=Pseudoxanthomonas yeongjuensis TaxID=377616 RepID=UPI001391BDDB|nr:hypothetical protein [Pseudoxanthomonas yeongjuensis]